MYKTKCVLQANGNYFLTQAILYIKNINSKPIFFNLNLLLVKGKTLNIKNNVVLPLRQLF